MKNPQISLSKSVRRVVGGLMLAAVAITAHAQATLSDAMELYETAHWSAAYANLVALADQNDIEAARIVLLMKRYGPVLYKTAFTATAPQVERWTQLASRQLAASLQASSTSRP